MKKATGLLLLGLAISSGASAQQPAPVSIGAGAQSCDTWVTLWETTNPSNVDILKKNVLVSWVQGYVVGFASAATLLITRGEKADLKTNQDRFKTASGLVFDPPDVDALMDRMTKQCRENRSQRVTDAALALAGELAVPKK